MRAAAVAAVAAVPTHTNVRLVPRALDAPNPHLNVRRCRIIRVLKISMLPGQLWRILASLECKYPIKNTVFYFLFVFNVYVYIIPELGGSLRDGRRVRRRRR